MLKTLQLQFFNRFWLCVFCACVGSLYADPVIALQTGSPPGVVVTESSDSENWFCGHPSIIVLPNGDYLISVIYEGKGSPNETEIHVSKNKGRDWKKLSSIKELSGASFVAKGDEVFLMGIRQQSKHAAIVVSSDNGATWSKVKKLSISDSPLYAMPNAILIHDDRVWRSYTSLGEGEWFVGLFCAPYSSNWLDADSWTELTPANGRINFLGGRWNPVHQANPIPTPSGVALLAACNAKTRVDTAAVLPVSADGKSLVFDESNSLIDFPGGGAKFTARFDPKSQKYWAITNKRKNPFAFYNYQVLVSSSNLRDWTINSVLFRHLDNYHIGKRHADWVFDGEDLILVSMTAWGGESAEKPTQTVFDRVRNFRSLNSTRDANVLGDTNARANMSFKQVTVTGKYIDTKILKDGVGAVSHYSSKYEEVPDRIKGWKLVRTRGGYPSEIIVTATADCEIFMVTVLGGSGVIDVGGWTLEPEVIKGGAASLSGLFSRKLRRGEKVVLPQGTWGGSQLLLPPGS